MSSSLAFILIIQRHVRFLTTAEALGCRREENFPQTPAVRCLQGDTSCGWDLALYLSYLHPPPWYQHILTVEKQHPTPQMRGTKIATAAGRIGSRGRYERYNKASIQQSPPDGGRTAAGGKGGGSAHSRSMALTGQDSLAWEAVFSRVSVTS